MRAVNNDKPAALPLSNNNNTVSSSAETTFTATSCNRPSAMNKRRASPPVRSTPVGGTAAAATTIIPVINNSDDSSEGTYMYSDFFLLMFLAVLLFIFCTIGAVVIYIIEMDDGTLLPTTTTNNKPTTTTTPQPTSSSNNDSSTGIQTAKNEKEIVLSLADYFDSATIEGSPTFEQSAKRLIEFALSEAAGIAVERLQMSNMNATHVKIAIKPEYVFDVYGSFFFSFDVITTIGFGQRYPVTNAGKIWTTFLTLLGCPLIVLFCDVLAEKMKITGFRIRRSVFRIPLRSRFIEKPSSSSNSSHQITSKDIPPRTGLNQQSQQAPATQKESQTCRRSCSAFVLESIGITVFILGPSVAFYVEEAGWTYLDSIYFSVNALSTTGFGDYIAGENPKSPVLGFYRFFYVMWLLVGMAWWNAYIDVSAERLRRICNGILRPLTKRLNKLERSAMTAQSSSSTTAVDRREKQRLLRDGSSANNHQ